MTSTPDCFAVTSDTPPSDQHTTRARFLHLVADARSAVQAALAPQPDDGADRVDALGEGASAGRSPLAAQRVQQVVSVLLDGHAVERADVRVVG